jgi:GT2 family glycosyltransferase
MDKQIDVSVIIISFNTRTLLKQCLMSVKKSLSQSSISSEVIIVDNNSVDGTQQMISTDFPEMILLSNQDNNGFGRANNQAIKIAQGKFVLLLNSDTIVLNNSIEKLFHFSNQKNHAFVGPKLLNADRSAQTSCGPFLTLPVVFLALFLKGDKFGFTRFSPKQPKRIDWVSGACLMAPKQLFMDGLLFDESIHMYMEEIDLLYRASKKGYKTYFTPGAKFVHYGAASSGGNRKQPVLNIYKGLIFFYRKHYGMINLFLLRILLKIKAIIGYIIGITTGNVYLRETYGEAYKLV